MQTNNIKDWIARISLPSDKIGGMSVCPFAKNAKYIVLETRLADIKLPTEHFEVCIFCILDDVTVEELDHWCKQLSVEYPDMTFLPDHKDRDTFINGVPTNNGKHNLILCQWTSHLSAAREKLAKTHYYDHWDEAYLKEILGL